MLSSVAVVLLCLLLLAAAVVGGLFAYFRLRFGATPEARWARAVRSAADSLKVTARQAHQQILHAEGALRSEGDRLREQALERYFQSISVEALAAYPGIGPATVARLRERGLHNLAQFRKPLTVEVPGLGPKRTADLKSAIRALLRDATSRFDAGATPEAQELASRLAALAQRHQPAVAVATERMRVAQSRLERFRQIVEIAEEVTLTRFYRKQGYPGLTPELLGTPVEQLVPTLTAAEPAKPRAAVVPSPPLPPPIQSGTIEVETTPGPAVILGSSPLPRPAPPGDLFRGALEQGPTRSTVAAPAHPRLPHLRLTAEFASAVARADGRVANAEREAIREYLQQAFGHEPDLVRFINPLCEQYEKEPIDLESCLDRVKELFGEDELQQLYALAMTVADAAGKRNKKEDECLARVRRKLSLADAVPTAAKPQAAPTLSPDDCRSALEIARDVALSADLVRRQFRLLRERYDPARFESHGQEFIDVAHRKLERIEAAARALLAVMNEPLEIESGPAKVAGLRDNPDLDAIFG